MKKFLIFFLVLSSLASAAQLNVTVTGYSSDVYQTDATPTRTSIGARTTWGVVAASRDLIKRYGYHATVRFSHISCKKYSYLRDMVFVVKDTMHPRMYNTIDIWFPSRRQALNFGKCSAQVEIRKAN
jgi:3D (Asp-Asp-Asp) domain-containing protein